MAEDKLIKTGQLTFARILFLAVCGGLIFAFVAIGGKFLAIGYVLVTIAICVLLYLIAIDYGVSMEKVDTTGQSQTSVIEPGLSSPAGSVTPEVRVKRRVTRTATKRRR